MEKIDIQKEGNGRPLICADTSKTLSYFIMKKLNEIIDWINKRRTLADMSPEEIEKINKYIQELDKQELQWKK